MKTVFILSGIPYKFMKQRPHHMSKFLANQDCRVIYIGLTEGLIDTLSNDLNTLSSEEALESFFEEEAENIYTINRIYKANSSRKSVIEKFILKMLEESKSDDLTIIVTHPDWIDYLTSAPKNVRLIYDCLDDWEEFLNDLDLGMKE